MLVGRVVGRVGQGRLLGEELALGMGMVVEEACTPIRAAGSGQWLEEELPEEQQAWQEPERPCGGRGGGGCEWCGGSAGVGEVVVVVAYNSSLGRLVHTLGRCMSIHKGLRLSFL